jgi:hypothetical protein
MGLLPSARHAVPEKTLPRRPKLPIQSEVPSQRELGQIFFHPIVSFRLQQGLGVGASLLKCRVAARFTGVKSRDHGNLHRFTEGASPARSRAGLFSGPFDLARKACAVAFEADARAE